jgi:hypothetical protein
MAWLTPELEYEQFTIGCVIRDPLSCAKYCGHLVDDEQVEIYAMRVDNYDDNSGGGPEEFYVVLCEECTAKVAGDIEKARLREVERQLQKVTHPDS